MKLLPLNLFKSARGSSVRRSMNALGVATLALASVCSLSLTVGTPALAQTTQPVSVNAPGGSAADVAADDHDTNVKDASAASAHDSGRTLVVPTERELVREGATVKMPDAEFAAALKLDELKALSLQDRQTIKTWDTYGRQMVNAVAGRSSIDGREPLFTVLDIGFAPERYVGRPILRIKNPQFLSDLLAMPELDESTKKSIRENKAVSLTFWMQPTTQQFIQKMQTEVIASRDTINQIQTSANTLMRLIRTGPLLSELSFVPPASGAEWHNLTELRDNVAFITTALNDPNAPVNPLPGYDNERIAKLFLSVSRLGMAWREQDAAEVQKQIDFLASDLPTLTTAYPSSAKRHAELVYNKFYKLTLPGAAIYFVAFVLFIIAAYSRGQKIRRWAIGFTVVGILLHTAGIGIRWWLDQKSTGSWFYSIPIKNQFESVMFSAWFGMLVGLALELWKKKGLFGAAASFVGWMSLVALFTVPHVFGKDIGGEIGRVNGILMSYWLYIHVTLATASYGLIGMSFLLGVWWLVRFYGSPAEVRSNPLPPKGADRAEMESEPATLSMAFATSPVPALAGGAVDSGSPSGNARRNRPAKQAAPAGAVSYPVESRLDSIRVQLKNLDSCNVVILQLAFWILGLAIVCGAIWADVSWGRPWGWDPKETFALVTWLVYLVIIHIRMVTKQKALWTAILCIVGFFVMLFNWIGVNYFLVGLHSYA